MKVNELLEGEVVALRKGEPIRRTSKRPNADTVNGELDLNYLWARDLKLNDNEDELSTAITPLEVKRVEKQRDKPFKRLTAKWLWGKGDKREFPRKHSTLRFPRFENRPFDRMFIVKFSDNTEYVAKTNPYDNSQYVVGWLQIK